VIGRLLGRRDPHGVVGYRGYGTTERFLVLGRALEDDGLVRADPAHSRWRNLREAMKRFDADPLPHARVHASVVGARETIEADDEGFLHHWLPLPAPVNSTGWHEVELTLDAPDDPDAIPGVAHVLVPPPSARFGVISDIDDTVLQSMVATPLHAARLMLFENARTRLPFPGVAAFYRALVAGGDGDEGNPIFYVSSSPWNVHDVLTEFLDAQEIPLGPLLLRDWDLGLGLARNAGHKAALIGEIVATYPAMSFILIGDTSQEDPEIYTRILREHPGRILAIYIRDVGASAQRLDAVRALVAEVEQTGTSLVLAAHTLDAARHAASQGWIDAAHLAAIGEEKREAEGVEPGKADPARLIGPDQA